MVDSISDAGVAALGQKAPGLTIAQKLVLAFMGLILALGGLLVLVYERYVPAMVIQQVELRAESVARSFAGASLKPVVERDYLLVNKLADGISKLPDVAYAAAINNRGLAVAGLFGAMDGYNQSFITSVNQNGFPKDIVERTQLAEGQDSARRIITIGGQEVMDYALRLPQTDSVIHVGLFTSKVEEAREATLIPLLIILAVMAVAGTMTVVLVARSVSRPIRQLSAQAESISMGRVFDDIEIKAGGEVWQLAESFKRMQASVRFAMNQMQRAQHQ